MASVPKLDVTTSLQGDFVGNNTECCCDREGGGYEGQSRTLVPKIAETTPVLLSGGGGRHARTQWSQRRAFFRRRAHHACIELCISTHEHHGTLRCMKATGHTFREWGVDSSQREKKRYEAEQQSHICTKIINTSCISSLQVALRNSMSSALESNLGHIV